MAKGLKLGIFDLVFQTKKSLSPKQFLAFHGITFHFCFLKLNCEKIKVQKSDVRCHRFWNTFWLFISYGQKFIVQICSLLLFIFFIQNTLYILTWQKGKKSRSSNKYRVSMRKLHKLFRCIHRKDKRISLTQCL